MLIFDSFPDHTAADHFAQEVTARFGLWAAVFQSQDESNEVDPFPFVLLPPIVLVARDRAKEEAVEQLVEKHEGRFAGT